MEKRPYTKPGRLSDVLALIQVLALDEKTHRSLEGLIGELQATPRSSDSWINIAKQHPEFFRVREEVVRPISLVGRHVVPRDDAGVHAMPPELVHTLIQTALELHDRQVNEADWWKSWIPVVAVLLAGIIGTVSTLLVTCLKVCQK